MRRLNLQLREFDVGPCGQPWGEVGGSRSDVGDVKKAPVTPVAGHGEETFALEVTRRVVRIARSLGLGVEGSYKPCHGSAERRGCTVPWTGH